MVIGINWARVHAESARERGALANANAAATPATPSATSLSPSAASVVPEELRSLRARSPVRTNSGAASGTNEPGARLRQQDGLAAEAAASASSASEAPGNKAEIPPLLQAMLEKGPVRSSGEAERRWTDSQIPLTTQEDFHAAMEGLEDAASLPDEHPLRLDSGGYVLLSTALGKIKPHAPAPDWPETSWPGNPLPLNPREALGSLALRASLASIALRENLGTPEPSGMRAFSLSATELI